MSYIAARKGTRLFAPSLVVVIAAACMALFAFTAPAYAANYELELQNQMTNTGSNVFYGLAGEKLSLVPVVYNAKTYEEVDNVVYECACDSGLDATVSDDTVTFNELPASGKYKVVVKAYNKKGKLLCSKKYQLQVKKKPAIKTKVTNKGTGKNLTKVKRSQAVFLTMKGAKYGWSNSNVFYKWTVKYKKTGKTVSWNSNKWLGNTSIIKNATEGMGMTDYPTYIVAFKKAGTYKITAKMYHSKKVIAKSTRTLKVQ